MNFIPLPPYFIIKISIEFQKKKRELIDNLMYRSPDFTFMQNEIQYGEITAIGSSAAKEFPQASIGDTLIFHHFVTGKSLEDNGENPYLLDCDNEFNYYIVTAMYFEGEKNLTYGVIKNGEIIPHKDYIFLSEQVQEEMVVDESGLITVNYSESRDERGDKMKEIKNQVKELTKTAITEDLQKGIENKERLMSQMSKLNNSKEYKPYRIAFINPETKSQFTKECSIVGMLNIACNTKVEVLGIEYIISPVNYLAFGTS